MDHVVDGSMNEGAKEFENRLCQGSQSQYSYNCQFLRQYANYRRNILPKIIEAMVEFEEREEEGARALRSPLSPDGEPPRLDIFNPEPSIP